MKSANNIRSNPKNDSQEFSFSFGSDILQEFVLEHSASDVPRELVQNEYDAGGSQMEVSFGAETLVITGNGKPIDKKGWDRLSVVLGTGTVGETNRTVEAKTNSIGSKNFGLRSLFLFGDQIHIRSHGKATTLDTRRGARIKPVDDPGTKRKRGVLIEVPFRVHRNRRLLPFDEDAERKAFDSFKAVLGATLIKLARPGLHAGLRGLRVSSVRQGKTLEWIETVRQIEVPQKLGQAFIRSVRIREAENSAKPVPGKKVQEIEFETTVKWLGTFSLDTVPSYFLVPGGRIRIAVSIPLRNKGMLDTSATGQYYYPLGAPRSSTGNCISVCAPFEMNADRSDIIPLTNSDQNRWLIAQAADFTWKLLITDWITRFGPEVYLCFINQGRPSDFSDGLWKRLHEDECWATRALDRRKKPVLKKAADLIIPESRELDSFLSDECYPLGLDNPQLMNLFNGLAVKKFTLNSLVRLRCCGIENANLKTRLRDTEANYHYKEYEQALIDLNRQIKFAHALNAKWSKLSPENKQDLKSSPSTLTDAGTLAAPSQPLWRIDVILVDQVPLHAESRLHSSLTGLPLFKKLCESFDPSGWAVDIATKSKEGRVDEASHRALYKYIISNQVKLSTRAARILRTAPVLLDHRREWACPKDIILRSAKKARDLEGSLHFPHPDYSRNKAVIALFKFRTRLQGTDIVAYAKLVERDNSLAEAFENTLGGLSLLLTPKTIRQLKDIPFVRSSLGGVAAPSRVYQKTKLTEACLGQESPFVTGSNRKLYERLQCPGEPRAADILKHLRNLRSSQVPPKWPAILYPTLVDRLAKDRGLAALLNNEELVFVGDRYEVAEDILLGARHRRIFLEVVPIGPEPESVLGKAFAWLSACPEPKEHHWGKLLAWFDNRASTGKPLSDRERSSIRLAYLALGDKGSPMSADARCLISEEGLLYSEDDAAADLFLINDDWALAKEMKKGKSAHVFADISEQRTLAFYRACSVRKLTQVRQNIGIELGEELPPLKQSWLDDVSHTLRNGAFPSALATLLRTSLKGETSIGTRLPTEEQIEGYINVWDTLTYVASIEVKFRVGTEIYTIPIKATMDGSKTFLSAPIKRRQDILTALSYVVADTFVPLELRGTLIDAIRVIMDCTSADEFQDYFAQREIAWSPPVSNMSDEDLTHQEVEVEDRLAEELRNTITELVGKPDEDEVTVTPVIPKEPVQETPAPSDVYNNHLRPIPPIGEVLLEQVACDPEWSPNARTGGGGKGGTGVPHQADQERIDQIGLRGEELIYLQERERIINLGYPKERVVWVSKDNRTANHDILSVASDGTDIYIEVKSTSGEDGRFTWPRAEFKLAIEKRDKYILYRVYEADTLKPKYKVFQDPVALLSREALRLNVDTLSAQVEPL